MSDVAPCSSPAAAEEGSAEPEQPKAKRRSLSVLDDC